MTIEKPKFKQTVVGINDVYIVECEPIQDKYVVTTSKVVIVDGRRTLLDVDTPKIVSKFHKALDILGNVEHLAMAE